MDKITRLTIGLPKITANNTYHETSGKVHEILLSRSNHDRPTSYYGINNLSNTGKIEVFQKGEGKLSIPDDILDNLGKYLSDENILSSGGFDCVDFSHFLLGYNRSFIINTEHYDFLDFCNNELKIGSLLMTINSKGNIINDSHLMVYLGNGFYISKFGSSGRIIITTLDEYKNIYPFDSIHILKPKLDNVA